jgi:hypothetical protein
MNPMVAGALFGASINVVLIASGPAQPSSGRSLTWLLV